LYRTGAYPVAAGSTAAPRSISWLPDRERYMGCAYGSAISDVGVVVYPIGAADWRSSSVERLYGAPKAGVPYVALVCVG
jgi:hypothetical protein